MTVMKYLKKMPALSRHFEFNESNLSRFTLVGA